MDNSLFYIVEPSYITPFWFSQSIQGLSDAAAKKKIQVVQVNSIDLIDSSSRAVVIIGNTKNWINEEIAKARQKHLKTVLLGAIPDKYGEDVSGTMYGGKSVVEQLVRYFYFHGKRRLALIDINSNSSNDLTKVEAFLEATKKLSLETSYNDIFFKGSESHNPTENFLNKINNYDGVICSNDYTGAFILTYARENNIKIPEKLFVAGLGDIMLCRYTNPSLTSATRSYYESGAQIFSIWNTLSQNPDVVSIVTTMRSVIKPRGSTAFLPVNENIEKILISEDIYTGTTDVIPIVEMGTDKAKTIQECFSQCDNLDMKIIVGAIEGKSNEELAESLCIAPGTINYRLKKLYRNSNVSTKGEFIELLKQFICVEAINKDTKGMK